MPISKFRPAIWVVLPILFALALAVPAYSQGSETIIDDSDPDKFSVLSGSWTVASNAEAHGGAYRYNDAGTGQDAVQWIVSVPTSGHYTVYAYWPSVENAATDAPFTVVYHGGEATARVNQRAGNKWTSLGFYYFVAGENGRVILKDNASGGIVIADAVLFASGAARDDEGRAELSQKFISLISFSLVLFGLLISFHKVKPLRKVFPNPVLFLATVLIIILIMTRGLLDVPAFSKFIGSEQGPWGSFFAYNVFVTGFGLYVMFKYKSWYIRLRTLSMIFFAEFLLAFIVTGLAPGNTANATKILYPFPFSINSILDASSTLLLVVAVTSFLIFPLLALFLGKRFYCGWVCGHGVFSETFGDPFRTRAPKGNNVNPKILYALENLRYLVLIFTFITVALVLYGIATVGPYGLAASWSTVIGLGTALIIMPIIFFGGRTYCRFMCPMGAYLGVISRVGQHGIVTNKSKCTRCGLCNRNCHMGIDIQSFAQEGRVLRLPQCVGCGICIATCPTKALRFRGIRESASLLFSPTSR